MSLADLALLTAIKWFARGKRWQVHCATCGETHAAGDVSTLGKTLRREALIEAGQACVDWAEDTGDCHLCGYDQGAGKPHDEDCPLSRLGA